MLADRASRRLRFPLAAALPLALFALGASSCKDRREPQPPTRPAPDAATRPVGPLRGDLWKGPLPPVPTAASPRFAPLPTLVTQRLDQTAAARRVKELAQAAAAEIAQVPVEEERARQLARLCRRVASSVETAEVDGLARQAFAATAVVKGLQPLQDAFEALAECLAHASPEARATLLEAVLTRAAKAQEISLFTWPLHGARPALATLEPGPAERLLALAEKRLPEAKEPFQREHLLSGTAALGAALPPARALALLARAEAGMAGPAHAESRPVVLAEIAQAWVWLAGRQPTLLERAADAILRLAVTPYDRASALDKLLSLPGFSASPSALAVLRRLEGALPKLPTTERQWLRRKLVQRAAALEGGLPVLQSLLAAADPDQAYRAHVVAVRSLAARKPAEAVRLAEAAVGLLDKLSDVAARNWRQAYLFRALAGVDPAARQPLLARLEKRAAGFENRLHTAWTLRKILELRKDRGDAEGLRLQAALMAAVAAIPQEASRLRMLQGIHALGLSAGPAAAEPILVKAIAMTGTGATDSVWAGFARSVSKGPEASRRRFLPRLLGILVRLAPAWRPEDLASRARLVARLAPTVMSKPEAEALLLRVWQAIEAAPRRSAEVERVHVVTALRAVGVGLAALGSAHFPVLVRRLEARVPRQRKATEPLMSQVTSLGCLLTGADAVGFQQRLAAWVARGDEPTRLLRRGAIVAGLVACHGRVDPAPIREWLAKGPAELSFAPMIPFLVRLPMPDLKAKAALLPDQRQRIRMYRALTSATIERASRELSRWRRSRTPRR